MAGTDARGCFRACERGAATLARLAKCRADLEHDPLSPRGVGEGQSGLGPGRLSTRYTSRRPSSLLELDGDAIVHAREYERAEPERDDRCHGQVDHVPGPRQ